MTSFWLLVDFSRSRLRLNDLSVANILHSILGGGSSLFVLAASPILMVVWATQIESGAQNVFA